MPLISPGAGLRDPALGYLGCTMFLLIILLILIFGLPSLGYYGAGPLGGGGGLGIVVLILLILYFAGRLRR